MLCGDPLSICFHSDVTTGQRKECYPACYPARSWAGARKHLRPYDARRFCACRRKACGSAPCRPCLSPCQPLTLSFPYGLRAVPFNRARASHSRAARCDTARRPRESSGAPAVLLMRSWQLRRRRRRTLRPSFGGLLAFVLGPFSGRNLHRPPVLGSPAACCQMPGFGPLPPPPNHGVAVAGWGIPDVGSRQPPRCFWCRDGASRRLRQQRMPPRLLGCPEHSSFLIPESVPPCAAGGWISSAAAAGGGCSVSGDVLLSGAGITLGGITRAS